MGISAALGYVDQFVKLFLTARSVERIAVYTTNQLHINSNTTCEIPPNPFLQHLQNPHIAYALSGNVARTIDSSNKFIQFSKMLATYNGNQADLIIAATSLTAAANTAAHSHKIEASRAEYMSKIKEIENDLNNNQCPDISSGQLFSLAKHTWETKSECFYMTAPETLSIAGSFLIINSLKLYTGAMPINQIIPTLAAFFPIIYSRLAYHSYIEAKTNAEQTLATKILTRFIDDCLDPEYLSGNYSCNKSDITAGSLLSGICMELPFDTQ